MQLYTLPAYLAMKEVVRNRGRFLLVSLVIALITLLVLFIAGLASGLGNSNKEYLSKLDAGLLAYSEKSDFLIAASRLPRALLNAIRRVAGVADAGGIATATANLIVPGRTEPIKVSLLGVDPGHAGEPPALEGQQLSTDLANEVILDRNVLYQYGYKIGDLVTIRVTQGTQDEMYDLKVVGITDGQKYLFQPAIFVPYHTWDRIRPKSEAEVSRSTQTINVVAVRLSNPAETASVQQRLASEVTGIQVASIPDAIKNIPGYSAQQSTLQTQGGFTLLIGVLVVGGFFQIQILQKVPQIGVLKAIGAPNMVVAAAAVFQIVLVTTLGVAIGALGTFLLALGFPPSVPIVFDAQTTIFSLAALLLIGPLGGLVSIRYAVRIEPLRALGLAG